MQNRIHINQLGYRPDDMKRAVIPRDCAGFSVTRLSDNSAAYESAASEPLYSPASDETVRIADFSALSEAGEYVVCASGERSFPFRIGADVYGDLRRGLLGFYHYQKCGNPLDAGVWSHPPCHNTKAYILDKDGEETGETRDVSGGWHDAGDYGRYVVPAAMTTAQLLWGYELSPNPDKDLLGAVWYKLEWLLKMQDPATGGVYHKVSCREFPPLDANPEQETERLVLSPISATATADFAASVAMASRFYPERKDPLLDAAKRAWQWCLDNPRAQGFENPRGVNTGSYADGCSKDERFWAAAELFVATGDEAYHDYIKTADLSDGLGWAQMGTYGLIAYLFHAEDKADEVLKKRMENRLLFAAKDIMLRYEGDPYGVSLGTAYRWGSNMNVGNNAATLLLAEIFLDDKNKKAAYRNAALDHMHYLLGKNALSQCYVTGYGSKPARNPHHRPSVAVGKTVPGMVVGGPCMNLNIPSDPVLAAHCAGQPPAKCYTDHIESCASNEITIYWNSPMYLAAAILGF